MKHETWLVMDRERQLYQFWCVKCDKSGAWHVLMDRALEEGDTHREMTELQG